MNNTNWKKGQWLKGLNLSGSQADYVLSVISNLLNEQLEEAHLKWNKEMREMVKQCYVQVQSPTGDFDVVDGDQLLKQLEGRE